MLEKLPDLPLASPPRAPAGPEKVSALRWAFRFLRWSTYLLTLLTIVLLLRKSPAPPVATTTQAAASAEEKVAQVQQSVSQGQPATLRLNQTELNSYLADHLNLAPQVPVTQEDGGPGAPTASDIEQARSTVKDV